jgi:hypothetical protein
MDWLKQQRLVDRNAKNTNDVGGSESFSLVRCYTAAHDLHATRKEGIAVGRDQGWGKYLK